MYKYNLGYYNSMGNMRTCYSTNSLTVALLETKNTTYGKIYLFKGCTNSTLRNCIASGENKVLKFY